MVYKRLERFLIQLDNVDSTNNYAHQLLKTGQIVSGTIILAHHQHSGRGQRSTTWTTEAGKNLTCSVILVPGISVKHAFYLNIIAALALRKTLSDIHLYAKVKWPNDILISGKKLCGILIENQISGGKITGTIVGIGLNINQVDFGDVQNATSLKKELNREFEVTEILDQLYGYLDFYYDLLLDSNFDLLLKHYYKHLYLLGIPSEFKDSKGRFEGVILGIDSDGRLLIQRENEKVRYELKEISYCV